MRLFSTVKPLSLSFHYGLFRELLAKSYRRAVIQETGVSLAKVSSADVIGPFGFELLSSPQGEKQTWPDWPRRFFPALKIPKSVKDTERFGMAFLKAFQESVLDEYPELNQQLCFLKVHGGGSITKFGVRESELNKLSSMHVELFRCENILEHYANYLLALVGTIAQPSQGGALIPEIRDFDDSKACRNRLFQLFVMCDALTEPFLTLPPLSPSQQALYQEIFQQLRVQNPSEFMPIFSVKKMRSGPIEKQIRDELIYPRSDLVRKVLNRMPGERGMIISPPYHNGNAILKVSLPVSFVRAARQKVITTYEEFPHRVSAFNKSQNLENGCRP